MYCGAACDMAMNLDAFCVMICHSYTQRWQSSSCAVSCCTAVKAVEQQRGLSGIAIACVVWYTYLTPCCVWAYIKSGLTAASNQKASSNSCLQHLLRGLASAAVEGPVA